MRKFFKTLLKICKWILIVLLIVILLFFIVRFIGQRINSRTPEGGINETMFVDINGTKQWISIYGQDRNNPVLLYLHGGPCGPTSAWDWQVFRRISDVYTVVNWDQRGCGHNYPDYKEHAPINAEIMLADGKAMTDFLCEHLQKEQITLYGNSWGSIFAANLALDHPEKYEKLTCSASVADKDGVFHPNRRAMEKHIVKSGAQMGLYAGKTRGGFPLGPEWRENDGLVNTFSARAPFFAPQTDFVPGKIRPGVWNVMPVYPGDHMSLQGGLAHVRNVRPFYEALLAMLKHLPE